jgi:hypothetical protein
VEGAHRVVISEATFRGRALDKTFTGTITLHPRAGRAWRLVGSSTPVVQMVDATTIQPDQVAVVWNAGGTAITFKDADGGTIGSVASGGGALLSLHDKATTAGVWTLFSLPLA